MKATAKWLAGPLYWRCNYHHDFPNLLSISSLFWSDGMRVELCQGRGLVGNLAGLLGDPVELAEIAGRTQETL